MIDYEKVECDKVELLSWHEVLMKGVKRIKVGQWRSAPGPMQVVSGAIGREIVHCLSKAIESVKTAYYKALKIAQRSNDLLEWILYFQKVAMLVQSMAEEQVEFTLKKARYLENTRHQLNPNYS